MRKQVFDDIVDNENWGLIIDPYNMWMSRMLIIDQESVKIIDKWLIIDSQSSNYWLLNIYNFQIIDYWFLLRKVSRFIDIWV